MYTYPEDVIRSGKFDSEKRAPNSERERTRGAIFHIVHSVRDDGDDGGGGGGGLSDDNVGKILRRGERTLYYEE